MVVLNRNKISARINISDNLAGYKIVIWLNVKILR